MTRWNQSACLFTHSFLHFRVLDCRKKKLKNVNSLSCTVPISASIFAFFTLFKGFKYTTETSYSVYCQFSSLLPRLWEIKKAFLSQVSSAVCFFKLWRERCILGFPVEKEIIVSPTGERNNSQFPMGHAGGPQTSAVSHPALVFPLSDCVFPSILVLP